MVFESIRRPPTSFNTGPHLPPRLSCSYNHVSGDQPAGPWSADLQNRRNAFDLFLISFLTLFFEILFIRWLASEIRIFAYFKNVALIACFLGLGTGVFVAKRRDSFNLFLPATALVVFLVYINPEWLRLVAIPGGDSISLWGFWSGGNLAESGKFFTVVLGFTVLTAAAFIPLGQKMGERLGRLEPLAAYSINIAGGLAGLAAFSALSSASAPPLVWFAAGAALSLYFCAGSRTGLAAGALATAAMLAFIGVRAGDAVWSPYQKITMQPILYRAESGGIKSAGYVLSVNHDFHQTALDLGGAAMAAYPEYFRTGVIRVGEYNLNFEREKSRYEAAMLALRPRDVLVVGSGMGNDVAAALRNGASSVDAVDIDPEIIRLGRLLHPEKPYSDPRVNIFVTDARSYFTNCGRKYDLIVFSLLDSHVAIASRSSLRLDNFVYTVDSFRQARKLLKKDGRVSLSFIYLRPWMRDRMRLMLEEAFGNPPVQLNDTTLLIGGAPHRLSGGRPDERSAIAPATDDWPFLYTRERAVPEIYLLILGAILAISAAFVFAAAPGARGRLDAHFFFLGAAFMLVETRGITQLALLFGSTWIVTSMVIAGVMVMILFANLAARFRPGAPVGAAYMFLAAALLANYFFPMETLLGAGFAVRAAAGAALVTLPVFFAGFIFATSFRKAADTTGAFASNTIGALAGGLFEYSSFIFGLKALCLFALLFYALSALPIARRK